MTLSEAQLKIQSAENLELTIEQDYGIVGGDFCLITNIKSGENIIDSFNVIQDKAKLLADYGTKIDQLNNTIGSIQEEIDKINAVE
jgi:hypothetical protein